MLKRHRHGRTTDGGDRGSGVVVVCRVAAAVDTSVAETARGFARTTAESPAISSTGKNRPFLASVETV
jgi:hypothetical protein